MNNDQADGLVLQLHKGMFITQEQCERLLGVQNNPNNSDYEFALLGLIDKLTKRSIASKTPLSMAVRNNGIIIHNDEEAVDYHEHQRKCGIKKFKRHKKYGEILVDQSQLSPEILRRHTNNMVCAQRIKDAIASASKSETQRV